MHRRKFLIGAGSVAAGASAVVGSGAFSATEMNRDANINVVNDANGLIALAPGPNVESDVVREENGELTIDFSAGGSAGGVNINSRYQVGTFDTSYRPLPDAVLETQEGIGDDFAFEITNQDSTEKRVHVYFQADDTSDYDECDLYIQYVPTYSDANPVYSLKKLDEDNGEESLHRTLSSADGIKVSLLVDTRDAKGEDPEDIDLSGELKIEAHPPEESAETPTEEPPDGPTIDSFSIWNNDEAQYSIDEGDAPIDTISIEGEFSTNGTSKNKTLDESGIGSSPYTLPWEEQFDTPFDLTLTVEDENGLTDSHNQTKGGT